MAHERSTDITHTENPDQRQYDWLYYNALLPHITGSVLDIGSGALQFAREYAKKEAVDSVIGLDQLTDNTTYEKITCIAWVGPEKLPLEMFDTIVSTEFVEHIEHEQLEPLLEAIASRMTPNAKFIGSTPNKLVPTVNPYHLYEYTKDELHEILSKYFSRVETYLVRSDCTVWICQK